MTTLTVTQVRADLSNTLDRVCHHGERIRLQRNGKDVVALVSVADAEILEALEDQYDLEEVHRRLDKGQKPISYKQVRRELGLV